MGFLDSLFGTAKPTAAQIEKEIAAKSNELADLKATTTAADDAAWSKRSALADAVARLEALLEETRKREDAERRAKLETELAEALASAAHDPIADHQQWFVEAHREARRRRAAMLAAVGEQQSAHATAIALAAQLGKHIDGGAIDLRICRERIARAIGADMASRREPVPEFGERISTFFEPTPR